MDGLNQRYGIITSFKRFFFSIPKEEQGNLGNRKSREYETKPVYKMKVFGDSFAYGSEVGDHETFEYFIEEKTGEECLNFGVGSFGTDQALLKYKDNAIKTKYTFLCIMAENIGRCMNIWRGFYQLDCKFCWTKPRFATSNPTLSRGHGHIFH